MDENYNPHLEERIDKKETPVTESKTNEERSSSIDFWSSRGNMGEKINVLISLNIITLDLISTLVLKLKEENVLSYNNVKELTFFRDYLANLLVNPTKTLDITNKLKLLESKITIMLNEVTTESIQSEIQSSYPIEQITRHEVIGIFQRKPNYIDRFGLIESTKALISSYSNLSHLGFPNYYLTACEEINKYEILPDSSLPDSQAVIQVPTSELKKIISKLLREAPSARLLQNLRRMFPDEYDSSPSSTETEKIEEIIKKYFLTISDYSDDNQSLPNSLNLSQNILREYNLGAGDLESRIPNISFTVVKEIHDEIQKMSKDRFKQFLLSETIILIHRLNDSILKNERFVFFLKRLK